MNNDRIACVTVMVMVVSGVAALGCGQVSHPSGVPITSAPTEIATTVCPKAYDCCSAAQLMGNSMAGTDETSCELKTSEAFSQQLSAIEASQKDGRSLYDGDALAACLKYVRSSTCETLGVTNHLAGIPGCDRFVQPLVANGGGCSYDWECTGGRCRDFVCEALPAVGAACPDGRCAAGSACDPAKVCVATRAAGDSCTEAAQCPSGACTAGTCAPRATTCFYASGCSVGGGGGGPLLPAVGIAAALLLATALRPKRRHRRADLAR